MTFKKIILNGYPIIFNYDFSDSCCILNVNYRLFFIDSMYLFRLINKNYELLNCFSEHAYIFYNYLDGYLEFVVDDDNYSLKLYVSEKELFIFYKLVKYYEDIMS